MIAYFTIIDKKNNFHKIKIKTISSLKVNNINKSLIIMYYQYNIFYIII